MYKFFFNNKIPSATLFLTVMVSTFLSSQVISFAQGDNSDTSSNKKLDEVVVTALGIKRDKKSLGYAVQDINTSELNAAQNPDPVGALSGKIAGMSVTSSSGDPGSGTYMLIRGATSVSGNNQPLMVIDGVPIDNSSSSIGNPDDGRNAYLQNASSTSRGMDINPNDIESISVLKGPAGAAIYGTKGSSGVILITTKRGKTSSGGRNFYLEYTGTVGLDFVNKLPDLQSTYIQGGFNEYKGPKTGTSGSWGPNKDTMYWADNYSANSADSKWDKNGQIIGKTVYDQMKKDGSLGKNARSFQAYDNAKDFFQVGVTASHAISLSTVSNKASNRLSISNTHQTGIVPLTDYNKLNASFNSDYNITDNFKVAVSFLYSSIESNRSQQGSNTSGIMLGLLRTPISFDNGNGLSEPWNNKSAYEFSPEGTQRNYRGGAGYDNPYWTLNKNRYNEKTNRVIGNLFLKYDVLSNLSISNRIGIDYYNTNGNNYIGINSRVLPAGMVSYNSEQNTILNNDLTINYSKKIGKNISLAGMLGWNVYSEIYRYTYYQGTGLKTPDFYHISNAATFLSRYDDNYLRRMGYYAQLSGSYKNMLFVELTGRVDQNSAFLPNSLGNNFYYSANGGFVFSDLIKNKRLLSFGKVKVSMATAGKAPSPYGTFEYYGSPTIADGWTTGEPLPYKGNTGSNLSGYVDPNLKPEITENFEVGAELRFFANTIALDYTYYHTTSKDLLINANLAGSTGNILFYTNAGEMTNIGHEISLKANIIRSKSFSWSATINWSTNKNEVVKLAPGIDKYTINGFEGSLIVATTGHSYGSFFGGVFLRDDKGRIVINDDATSSGYGKPMADKTNKFISEMNPKWIGGFSNTISYKGLSLYFLLDARVGQRLWNGTLGALTNFGVSTNTLNRNTTIIFNSGFYEGAVKGHTDDNGNLVLAKDANSNALVNDIPTSLNQAWYQGNGGGFGSVSEHFVEDASYLKLREISLSYSFPMSILSKIKLSKLSLAFVARNLITITSYSGVDPETSLVGARNGQGIDYFNNPRLLNFSFSITVGF